MIQTGEHNREIARKATYRIGRRGRTACLHSHRTILYWQLANRSAKRNTTVPYNTL